MREPPEVAQVLLPDRPVEPVLALDLLHGLRRRPLAEQRLGGAARKGPDPEEEQDREPEEDGDEKEQSADDELQHQAVVIRRLSSVRNYPVSVVSLSSDPSSLVDTVANDSPPTPTGLGTKPWMLLSNARAAFA